MKAGRPRDQYIKAGEINTRFWTVGDQGSPVILIHGLGASADIWMRNIESLAEQHRVYVPDVAGFGRSDKPGGPLSPFFFGRFLDDFMAALNIDQASLVGHSLGGGIALLHAIGYPEKVDKLVVADSAGLGREVIYTLRLMSLPLIGEIMSYPTRFGVAQFFKLAVRNPGVITPDIIDTYYEIFRQPGQQKFLLQVVRAMVTLRGGRSELLEPVLNNLSTITAPTLIMWGRQDRVLPVKHAFIAKDKIPGARLAIIENCGHITNLERPDEFNQVVREFLGT